MPLVDLLQWLGTARKTGTLAVRGARYTKRIYVKEGRIISSASDDPTEQLGQFLLSQGRITEEDLRRGLETQARTHVLLGKILLTVGAVKEDELRRLLVMKAEETIFSLFIWTDAHFDFADGELPKELFIPISLDVQDVLLKGLTVVDELRHIRSRFGSSRSVLRPTAVPLPKGFPPQRSAASAILCLLDGKRSIADICLALHASEFTVTKLLFHLLEKGFVEIYQLVPAEAGDGGTSDRPFLSADLLIMNGKERLDARDYEAAVDLLGQAVAAAPRDLEIKKMYDEACSEFREQAYRDHLPPNRIPTLLRPLDELTGEKLTPEEGFLISRINGAWDLKSIIDISPLGEVEALRIMKKLKDRRLIELR
jgi:hypothetical protein